MGREWRRSETRRYRDGVAEKGGVEGVEQTGRGVWQRRRGVRGHMGEGMVEITRGGKLDHVHCTHQAKRRQLSPIKWQRNLEIL